REIRPTQSITFPADPRITIGFMMEHNRNFFITIALSVLILVLWQVFYMNPRIEQQREAAQIEQARQEQAQQSADVPTPGQTSGQASPGQGAIPGAGGTEGLTAPAGREQALAGTPRVRIETPSVEGSINLTGGRLDDLKLKDYRETVDRNSPEIQLLNPAALPNGYYAELGF